ncbi:hypothetical protein FA15DRAFT_709790 [Coprinopsis marcescibilis]|uniref:Uncharacterized protein n=1 Tax=Coprinopsis marcescibilis TaxID=230819 RepID=A0A5C3KEZ6_COPMA|nr:hypothetical protein FA15DRAFT_709790 [Coprinopsis marcescibilis]
MPSRISTKYDFFVYLRRFTIALSAIERHRTVPNSEQVSRFSQGLSTTVGALINKHNPQNMDDVIAAGNAVFDYIGLLDSQTTILFNQMMYCNLETYRQSVIIKYTSRFPMQTETNPVSPLFRPFRPALDSVAALFLLASGCATSLSSPVLPILNRNQEDVYH